MIGQVLFSADTPAEEPERPDVSHKYVVNFKKMSDARFLGHLEMVKLFTRSLRREKIPIKYSHGFHPMPRVSFGDTLPMGMQSEDERMLVTLTECMDPEDLLLRLRRQMTTGLEITGCSFFVEAKRVRTASAATLSGGTKRWLFHAKRFRLLCGATKRNYSKKKQEK